MFELCLDNNPQESNNIIYLEQWRSRTAEPFGSDIEKTGQDVRFENPPHHKAEIAADSKPDSDVLFCADARWGKLEAIEAGSYSRGPRHQTLRRRGQALPYPKPTELEHHHQGVLQLSHSGISLSRKGEATPEYYFLPRQIATRTFYLDTIVLVTTSEARIVIQLEAADAVMLDVMCQAYLA